MIRTVNAVGPSFWLSRRWREFLRMRSSLLLARESCLDITLSMKSLGHLVHRSAKPCQASAWSLAVTTLSLCLLGKVKIVRGTRGMYVFPEVTTPEV